MEKAHLARSKRCSNASTLVIIAVICFSAYFCYQGFVAKARYLEVDKKYHQCSSDSVILSKTATDLRQSVSKLEGDVGIKSDELTVLQKQLQGFKNRESDWNEDKAKLQTCQDKLALNDEQLKKSDSRIVALVANETKMLGTITSLKESLKSLTEENENFKKRNEAGPHEVDSEQVETLKNLLAKCVKALDEESNPTLLKEIYSFLKSASDEKSVKVNV